MRELPNKYIPKEIEIKWRKFWEENKIFKAEVKKEKPKYSVVIPPPNVTGILHIGHILNNTIQDIYCRWKRMQGFEVCWVPGMDHAGIATQIKVEEELRKSGKSKYDLGREEFVKTVWDWKEKYGGIILQQLRQLGASVDWSRERFTLDKGLSKAIKEVFVDLYKKGLIYKGQRIVNWDNISQTALSDDEISYIEKKDKLYYIKYFITNSEEYITIATTRPETMLGDTAIAVHPEDSRYSNLKGKKVILPIVNRELPVLFDNYVDKEFGTGALKITPAHDINDFEVGRRHNLQVLNVLTKDGKINENGGEFEGLSINEARKRIVNKLKELGFLDKIEDYTHNVAVSERSKAIIEPYLSDQWFVSMQKLSEPALKVVEEGKIKFHPDKWVKTYYYWLRNVRDWCISRQLWWGHQIPIWYHKETGEIYCETNPPNDIENWNQDPDVLDTWFSSWLWPFSVFGWDNSEKDNTNEDLNYFYPTDFLSTAPEIIFLWVARMIMSGLEYRKNIPFKDVYFHSTVRDGLGRKMSKSLGNSPDPLKVMEDYGTDALRFTIVYLAPLGSDVHFDEKHTEIGRNFITKLWNAGRFILMNKEKVYSSDEFGNEDYEKEIIDIWIESRYNETLKYVYEYLNQYRLNDYTKEIYTFVWSDFCDWYIELLKIRINSNKKSGKRFIDQAISIYRNIVKLLHPVIPFVTEELWDILKEGSDTMGISKIQFPEYSASLIDVKIEEEFNILEEIVTSIRNIKAENNIAYSVKCDVSIHCSSEKQIEILNEIKDYIINLCNLKNLIINSSLPEKYVSKIITGYEIYLSLETIADDGKQKEKYLKEIENLEKYLLTIDKKLSNTNFLEKASAEVIEKENRKKTETVDKIMKLKKLI